MNEIIPRTPIDIRPATMADLAFIDALQKKQSKAVGFMPTKQLEQKIAAGHVLIAETMNDEVGTMNGGERAAEAFTSSFIVPTSSFPIAYCISQDRYFKRDDVGIVYALNVIPTKQRSLVGAMLLKTVFERAAYGCRLFCCWCAQDLDANYFWESMGFVPLAFRAGAVKKTLRGTSGRARVHVFWQRRICDGDVTTPYWYPCKTDAGAMRQDRLVFPIPPGVHWRDVEPVVLPTAGVPTAGVLQVARAPRPCRLMGTSTGEAPVPRVKRKSTIRTGPGPGKVAIVVGGRIKYIDRPGYVAPVVASEPAPSAPATALALPAPPVVVKRDTPRRAKIDPRYLAAARELRDRYLEHYNSGPFGAGTPALSGVEERGKYSLAKRMPSSSHLPKPMLSFEMRALPPAA